MVFSPPRWFPLFYQRLPPPWALSQVGAKMGWVEHQKDWLHGMMFKGKKHGKTEFFGDCFWENPKTYCFFFKYLVLRTLGDVFFGIPFGPYYDRPCRSCRHCVCHIFQSTTPTNHSLPRAHVFSNDGILTKMNPTGEKW